MRDLDKWTFMSEPSIEKYAIIISTELSNVNREKHKRKSHRFFPTESPSEHKYPSSYYTFNSLSLFWLDKSRNANLRRSQIWRLFFRTSTSSFPRPNSPMRSPAPRKCLFWFTPLPPPPPPPPSDNMHHARKWSQKPKRAISTLNKRLLTYTVSTQWHRRTIKLAISYGEFVYGYSHHLQVTLCSKKCMWTSNSGGWS